MTRYSASALFKPVSRISPDTRRFPPFPCLRGTNALADVHALGSLGLRQPEFEQAACLPGAARGGDVRWFGFEKLFDAAQERTRRLALIPLPPCQRPGVNSEPFCTFFLCEPQRCPLPH